jgi:hypothetical protein
MKNNDISEQSHLKFAEYLLLHYEYYDNTDAGNVYISNYNNTPATVKEIFDDWVENTLPFEL